MSKGCVMVASTPRMVGLWALALLSLSALALLATFTGHAQTGGPPLVVTAPEDGLVTNDKDISVIGTTAPFARVDLYMGLPSGGHLEYSALSDGRGQFAIPIRLYEGEQTIRVAATDASTYTNLTSLTVWLDTHPPQLSVYPPAGIPVYTGRHTYTIIFTVLTDGEVHPCVYPYVAIRKEGVYTFTVNLTEGENVFTIRVADRAGNVAEATVIIIADFTPPALGVSAPASGTVLTNKNLLLFAGNATGADRVVVEYAHLTYDASLFYRGDEGIWSCGMPLMLGDGTWTFTVRALDAVGNEANWSCVVRRDSTAPRLDLWPPLPEVCETPVLMVNGTTDGEVGMVQVNNVSYPVTDGAFAIPLTMREGWNDILVEAWDAAGNHASLGQTVKHSDGPPALRLLVPRTSKESHVHLRGTTDANVAKVLVNGMSFAVVNGRFDVVVDLAKGENRFIVEAVDPAGNVGADEVVVEHGTAGPRVAACVGVAATTMMVYWLVLGWRERRGGRGRE